MTFKKEPTPAGAGDVVTSKILTDLKERFIALAGVFFALGCALSPANAAI